ncbi:cytochrome P450 [Actinocrinis puniceicyclus]|uniref:Cytochrome P450 n=1 Tax=Actinocrinis puniceicyclus TaxID=977794 RepID=A0A8J7WKF4_9ACTN|nr:cytochrome P450 [Actinocrinis puniceicyclus]MBS2963943.1 cytochrome P450 [Actinocrinis puniceicyclus]
MNTPLPSPEPIPMVPHLAGCPYAAYATLREDGGVHRAVKPSGGEVWVISRYDDVRALLSDPRMSIEARHSRHGYQGFGLPPALDAHLMNVDDTAHARLRRLVSGAFTSRRIHAEQDHIQAITDALLDELSTQDTADLVTQYAAPIPIAVICHLLGIPENDGAAFQTYTRSLMNPNDPLRPPTRDLVRAMHACLLDLIARKRADPADDLLTAMIQARDGEDRLSENELISLVFLILWAGFETTVHLIANGLAALLAEPQLADLVRAEPDPHTPPMAALVEELLRRDGPMLTAIRRFPLQDLKIGERVVPAGDAVLFALASANHDTEYTPRPERIDLDRQNTGHLGFGHGPHYCLGAPLARMETRIALWTAIHRLPGLALAVPADQLPWKIDHRQHALAALPVSFTPQPHG